MFHNPDKERVEKRNTICLLAVLLVAFAVCLVCLLTSCNVTRTVTTTASHYQKGDTTVTIVTKTTESYDGAVKRENFLK